MVTNKRTETRLRGIKQNKMEIIPLRPGLFAFVCAHQSVFITSQLKTAIICIFMFGQMLCCWLRKSLCSIFSDMSL